MAKNYTTTSTINLQVNAKQASQMLDKLKKDTERLEAAFNKAEAAGDKVSMAKIRKQIKENEKLMRMFQTETAQAAEVLQRLDKASPKELKKTLKTLQSQLQGMQRGTDAWNRQVEAIRRVRSEIDRMNASMSQSQSWWQRFKDEMFSIQNVVLAVTAAITGFIAAGRRAVSEFTKMNEAETDTRKFTGLSADGIRDLNDAFREMDTRTAREKLNELAQEGGRLGKNTHDMIMGYVKGADVLNVALSDLGSGATEKVAKLSNIFKVEEQYGTYNAMLKVGSVINVLSQNCTASKPYLVEFANRLAGVGAQAQLSLQNIIGFGAVLDSNAQALEASATAVGQVLTRMYQDPAKYARVAGMDVRKFTDTLNKDANEALIMFLEHLSKAKDLSVLSPMFKDMGENGARVITALSTLSKHIDEVKMQQENANRAFNEGTSVLNEYNMFNNTAQASLDKAQKKMRELTIELGEKLYPVMSHIYSSSSLMLRVLSQIVTFVIEHRVAISSLALAMAGYVTVITAAAVKTKLLAAYQVAHAAASASARGAMLLLSAAYSLCSGNVSRAAASMRLFNATMMASPWGLAIAALSALIPLIVSLCSHTDTYIDKARKVIDKNKEISESVVKEQRELGLLVGRLKAAEEGTDDYRKAKDQLISQYGKYLSGLIDEKGEIIDLAQAYDVLAQAIDRSNRLRNINNAKNELEQEYDKSQMSNLNGLQKALENYGADPQTVGAIMLKVSQAVGAGVAVPRDVMYQIEQVAKSGVPLKSDSGLPLNAVNRWTSTHLGNVPGVAKTTSPIEWLNRISADAKEFYQARETLDRVELGINPTQNIMSEELLKSYYALEKIADGTAHDFVSVPDFYIPDDVPDAYFGHVYEKDDEKRHRFAAQSRAKDAGKYILLAPEEKVRNPLTDLDPDKSAFDLDPLDVVPGKRDYNSGKSSVVALSPAEAQMIKERIAEELRLRGVSFGKNTAKTQEQQPGLVDSYSSTILSDKERKAQEQEQRKREAEARRAAIKEKKEFKDALKAIRGQRDADELEAKSLRMAGLVDYRQYLELMREAEWDFHLASVRLYEKYSLQEDADYTALLEKEVDDEKRYNDQKLLLNKEAIERLAKVEEQGIRAEYALKINPSAADDMAMKEQVFQVNYKKLLDIQQLYMKGSKEWVNAQSQIDDFLYSDMLEKRKGLVSKAAEFQKEFDRLTVEEKYRLELEALDRIHEQEIISEEQYIRWRSALEKKEARERKEERDKMPGAASSSSPKAKIKAAQENFNRQKGELDAALASGSIDEKEYSDRLRRIKSELESALVAPLKEAKSEWVQLMASMVDAWRLFAEALKDPEGDPFDTFAKGLEASAALMSAITSQITEFTKAQTEIQIKTVEKRYDREIAFAEGNSFLTKKLEKERQDEIAKIKEDAAQKEFSMQVIGAVAQTAANAISAYGAALKIGGMAGLVLAPIAAGLAVAQGMVQVATLKKQKEAAASTGYSSGGFTKPGDVDEPAGIVHAGEWVASQRLVNSPVTRPVIDMLEYAQRTNRISSLSMEDVSRSVAAPMMLAYGDAKVQRNSSPEPVAVVREAPDGGVVSGELVRSLDRLNRRLDEPFVTQNSVTGPLGSLQAQLRYERMMKNKNPKKRS